MEGDRHANLSHCGSHFTISTYIKRIMWKGYLNKNVKEGSRFPTYSAAVSREDYFNRTAENFIKRWGKDAVLKMASMCEE